MIEEDLSIDRQRLRVETADSLGVSLANVEYRALTGVADYPDRIGRDIDLMVHPKDLERAVGAAMTCSVKSEWDQCFGRPTHYGVWMLFFARCDPDGVVWLEVDLIHRDLNVGAATLLKVGDILSSKSVRRGTLHVSPVGEYVKGTVRPILYGDVERFWRHSPPAPPDDESVDFLKSLMGHRLYRRYLDSVLQIAEPSDGYDGRSLKYLFSARYLALHPLQGIRNAAWSKLGRPVLLFARNRGFSVAIVSDDSSIDVGSLAEATRKYLNGLFDVRIRDVVSDPSESPSQLTNLPWRQHAVRLFQLTLSQVARDIWFDRFQPHSVIQLALYGGHIRGATRTPDRYGLRSSVGVRALAKLTRQPELVIRVGWDEEPTLIHRETKVIDPSGERAVSSLSLRRAANVGENAAAIGKQIVQQAAGLYSQVPHPDPNS